VEKQKQFFFQDFVCSKVFCSPQRQTVTPGSLSPSPSLSRARARASVVKSREKKQASDRLANVRKIVEERFAKYDNPDLPAEYQV
jgi:hypothetical protein